MDALVTTEWLAAELGREDLVVLDATYTSTSPARRSRIRGPNMPRGISPARYLLDLDTLVDADDPLPSMLPPRATCSRRGWRLWASLPASRVVLYDNSPHHTSCRAWWVLRMFGVEAACSTAGSPSGRPRAGRWQRGRTGARSRRLRPRAPRRRCAASPRCRRPTSRSSTRARRRASPATSPIRARNAASGHIPGSKKPPYGRFFEADGTWKRRGDPRGVRGCGSRPRQAAGRDLRIGDHRSVIAFAAHLLGRDAGL
jgi:thiosulfate/3-mercaptopyruvate sulfurtransferase